MEVSRLVVTRGARAGDSKARVSTNLENRASLHPTLTVQLLELFGKPSSNPAGAQLLFTSHDTNLLDHLNRDEVWLTQKGDDGAARFAALSDFAGESAAGSVLCRTPPGLTCCGSSD